MYRVTITELAKVFILYPKNALSFPGMSYLKEVPSKKTQAGFNFIIKLISTAEYS